MTSDMNLAPSVVDDVVGWDIENWSRALGFWKRRLPTVAENERYALELGCGQTSSLTLWLALQGYRILCSDQYGVSHDTRAAHARHAISGQVDYGEIDARTIPYRSEFDVIMFKSMLGGIVGSGDIGIARNVIASIHGALKPGGVLLFAENLYATPIHQFARTRYGAGKHSWRYFTVEELVSILGGFAKVEIVTWGFLGCFGQSERQRRLLGRLDQSVVDRLVPASWRYIAGVYAEK